MEEKRRRKAAKLIYMARYNDLMTQSDKDFITRIQVSQLVTNDPYSDDFYAQVYDSVMRSRMGLASQDERVLKFGSAGGVALGNLYKHRRPHAMHRMEQQVERIISNARKREAEKGLHNLSSLQGALGKTSGRSYKAAPRQLLQDDVSHPSPKDVGHISKADANKVAARFSREALSGVSNSMAAITMEPLTRREVLVRLEKLFDLVMEIEQVKHDEPQPPHGPDTSLEELQDAETAHVEWQQHVDALLNQLYDDWMLNVPFEACTPHPFVALLGPPKGKRLFPRITRQLPQDRILTVMVLLVGAFDQIDVVKDAHLLDGPPPVPSRQEDQEGVGRTIEFLASLTNSMMPMVSSVDLAVVTGLMSIVVGRTDVVKILLSRPGCALMTLLLSRVEVIKTSPAGPPATPEQWEQWQHVFTLLFNTVLPYINTFFPSMRVANSDDPHIWVLDQPVWQLLSTFVLQATPDETSVLVATLRGKILEDVSCAKKGWVIDAETGTVADENERAQRLANVDLFLNALNLDSSKITL
ncbi:hypothetical protein FISHEDRAFT_67415 [Fistulina hepatica ATCC 64428]|uniref:mRNA decay factor PAT1 domain-containing protein n=1 Tax=Fistulina hepatica ATCC 64428 TaxID=1128425 RepID=A0A0D7A1W4_9AGAR|nr:hypothetical protein FISHEDRAFT_67415 [Fistulina hepatica ATCC 64428]